MADLSKPEVTRILGDLERGDPEAADRLLPLVYDELRALAASFFRQQRPNHTLQPTALVHEAYVRLAAAGAPSTAEGPGHAAWTGRAHFFAVAAKAMRQILINHANAHRAAKRGGGWHKITLDDVATPVPSEDIDVLALDEAMTRLEALDERQCRVVELRFFGGLTVDEAAEVLKVSPRTVELDWRMARLWLHQELGVDDASDAPT